MWNPLRLARPTRGQISVSPAIAKAGTPSGQRVCGPTISRQVEALAWAAGWQVVVGASKEAGLCEDLDLFCRLASAIAKSLDRLAVMA